MPIDVVPGAGCRNTWNPAGFGVEHVAFSGARDRIQYSDAVPVADSLQRDTVLESKDEFGQVPATPAGRRRSELVQFGPDGS